jgi:NAD(P)-dependent dehydrogenase (short-subunit alcohol dehydrogenase family)
MIEDLHWEDLQLAHTWKRRGWDAYCQSKLANVMWTYWLARELEGQVVVNAFHPGFVRTGLGKNNGAFARALTSVIGLVGARTPKKGADTLVFCACADEMADVTGKYLHDRAIVRSSEASRDVARQERLMQTTMELLEGLDGA